MSEERKEQWASMSNNNVCVKERVCIRAHTPVRVSVCMYVRLKYIINFKDGTDKFTQLLS